MVVFDDVWHDSAGSVDNNAQVAGAWNPPLIALLDHVDHSIETAAPAAACNDKHL